MAERVRRHHVVSRFYLQRFADARGYVRQVWHPGERQHMANVANVSVVKDFYAVEFDADGATQVSDFWEREFSKIETPAAKAFSHALDDGEWPPRPEDRGALVSWLALQHVRNESARMMLTDLTAFQYRMIVGVNGIARLRQVMESRLDRTVGDAELEAEWEDLTQPSGPRVLGNANAHIDMIRVLFGRIADHFHSCGIMLWHFERKSLITGDHPVVLFGEPPFPGGGVGLSNADCAMIPMSRRSALMLSPSDPSDFQARGNARLAAQLNSAVSATSAQWLALHPDDDPAALDLKFHPPRTRAIAPPGVDGLVDRERPIESTPAMREYRSDHHPGSMPLVYPDWPLPGRVFVNPYAPSD